LLIFHRALFGILKAGQQPAKRRVKTDMRRQEARDQEITDQPSIWLAEGRYFLGISERLWRIAWEQVYKFIVYHWQTKKGMRLNLESLVAAVYPKTKKDTLARAKISHDFMWNLIAERRRITQERARRKEAKNEQTEITDEDENVSSELPWNIAKR
jgi:hypothetical protein